MIHPTTDATIIDDLCKFDPNITELTDLFGRGGWPAIRTFRFLADCLEKNKVPAVLAILGGLAWVLLALGVTIFAGVADGYVGAMIVLWGWLFILFALTVLIAYLADGLAKVQRGLSQKWLKKLAAVYGTTPGVLLDHLPGDAESELVQAARAVPERFRAQALRILQALAE